MRRPYRGCSIFGNPIIPRPAWVFTDDHTPVFLKDFISFQFPGSYLGMVRVRFACGGVVLLWWWWWCSLSLSHATYLDRRRSFKIIGSLLLLTSASSGRRLVFLFSSAAAHRILRTTPEERFFGVLLPTPEAAAFQAFCPPASLFLPSLLLRFVSSSLFGSCAARCDLVREKARGRL